MVRVRSSMVFLFFLAAALAGCVSGDDAEIEGGQEGEDDAQGGPKVVVVGRVMDEGLDPIEGASVTLSRDNEVLDEDVTDERGNYELRAPQRGPYRLHATSPCCHEDVTAVILREGENEMNFLLEFFSDQDLQVPRVEVGHWTGMLSCSARLPEPEGTGYNLACNTLDPNVDRYHDIDLEPGLKTIVMAMEWDSTASNLAETIVLRHDNGTVGGSGPTFFRVDSKSPIEVVLGPEDVMDEQLHFDNITDTWPTQIGVWAGQADDGTGNVVYQQEFTVYWELHYWDPAPDGASALPS